MKKLKIKITLLGLVAFLAICQMSPFKAFVNDVNLLSYQLIASAHAEDTSPKKKYTCYANISDTFFNAKPYVRCNTLVICADCWGKNPQDKSDCWK